MRRSTMDQTFTYSVPGVSCAHCQAAITSAVGEVSGVTSVDVNLESKCVTVNGDYLDDAAIRAAIDDAGYEAQ